MARKLAQSGYLVYIYDIEPKNSTFEAYTNITELVGDVFGFYLDAVCNYSIFVNMLGNASCYY